MVIQEPSPASWGFQPMEIPPTIRDPLLEWVDRLLRSADPEEVLREAAAALGSPGHAVALGLWLPDPEGARLRLVIGTGALAAAAGILERPLSGEPSCGAVWSYRSGRPSIETFDASAMPAVRLNLPLRAREDGEPMGVLTAEGSPALRTAEAQQRLLLLARRLAGLLQAGAAGAAGPLMVGLNRLARMVNEEIALEPLLVRIVRELVELLRGDRGAIALMAEEGDHLVVVAEHNPAGTPSGLGVKIPIAGNPSMAWILRERRPLAIPDVRDPILGPVGPVLGTMGIRSLLIVPLVVGERVIGTIGVDSVGRPRVFTEAEQQLAQVVAAQVAGAVERARLLAEAQRRAAHLEVLHAVLREATAAPDLNALMERALTQLRGALEAPMGAIYLPGRAVVHGLPMEARRLLAEAARAAGLALREPIAVSDWQALPSEHPARPLGPVMARLGIRASVTVPIGQAEAPLGGLSLAVPKPRVWRPEEIALMEAVGRELGAVMERLQLLERLRAQTERLHILCQTARALAHGEEVSELLDRVLGEIRVHLRADAVSVHGREATGSGLRRMAAQGFSPMPWVERGEDAGTITGRVGAIGEALWVEDCAAYPYPPETRALIEREGFRTHAALPLRHQGEILGVLNVLWRRPRALDPEIRDLLQSLADLLATGLHRAQLLEQARREAAERAALNRALGEALRLREEMIQNVSHELRTPLTVAMGYLELLAEGALGPLNAAQREAVEISRGRLQELHRYVELLLTMQVARAGEGRRQPLDLADLVREAARRLQARLDPARHALQVEIPEEPVWMVGDPEGLARALGEVLDNAVKFSPAGGRIGIALTVEGGEILLRVWDEGIGIPPEHLSRVGQPFYQVEGGTTRRFGGMGIGLAAVRAILEAHGGAFHIRPRTPRGTEVLLRLPLHRDPEPQTSSPDPDPRS